MPYFACYGNFRYIPKLANSREELVADSLDFKIAPDDFENYEDCDLFCRALNIFLKGNIPLDDEDDEC